jgi:hypothetical protein
VNEILIVAQLRKVVKTTIEVCVAINWPVLAAGFKFACLGKLLIIRPWCYQAVLRRFIYHLLFGET